MNEHYIKTINENDLYQNLVEYCKIYKEKISSDKEAKLNLRYLF